jgi:hypothetical protein
MVIATWGMSIIGGFSRQWTHGRGGRFMVLWGAIMIRRSILTQIPYTTLDSTYDKLI